MLRIAMLALLAMPAAASFVVEAHCDYGDGSQESGDYCNQGEVFAYYVDGVLAIGADAPGSYAYLQVTAIATILIVGRPGPVDFSAQMIPPSGGVPAGVGMGLEIFTPPKTYYNKAFQIREVATFYASQCECGSTRGDYDVLAFGSDLTNPLDFWGYDGDGFALASSDPGYWGVINVWVPEPPAIVLLLIGLAALRTYQRKIRRGLRLCIPSASSTASPVAPAQ